MSGVRLTKFHVDSVQRWDPFEHDGVSYDLEHLNCHELLLQKEEGKDPVRFVVTYGLHCFTKNDTGHNLPVTYADGREEQQICMERYEASKQLLRLLKGLTGTMVYLTQGESFFTLHVLNNANGQIEPYKVCMAIFREHRLLRMHVTSAFFARTGEGSPNVPIKKRGFSIFKVATDTLKKPKGQYPKEVRNRRVLNFYPPEKANPSLGGILSRQLHASRRGRSFLRRARRTGFPATGCDPFGSL